MGIVSYRTMPRSEDPQFAIPGVSVVVIYPGASTIDLEHLIVDPIEEEINKLDDIKVLAAHIEDGIAIVEVEFLMGSDPDDKHSEVVQQIAGISDNLPEGILDLDLIKWSVTDVNILQVALTSRGASYRELERSAEELKKSLEVIPGVLGIDLFAFPKQEIRVEVDLQKMAKMGIPLWKVTGAIQSSNANIPGGSIDVGKKKFNIKTSGDYESLEDIGNTIVHSFGGRVVHLRDIADIALTYEDKNYFARYDGVRAVFIAVTQKKGSNVFRIMDSIKEKIADFQSRLPAGIELETVFDQTVSVLDRINGFFSSFIQGVILVGVVVLLALGFRASGIVMLAIPFSVIIAIGLVDLSGYGLQQMSIVGLVIALGLLVDNAIVVVENTSRFLGKGHARRDAAVGATEQIGWAIVSATVTTVLAFLPIVLNRSVSGTFIRSMPLTVIFALSASLFISLTLTPFLSSKFLKIRKPGEHGLFRRILQSFIEGRYRGLLGAALRHPKITLVIATVIFLISLALFPLLGFSLFPKAEKTQLMIDIDTPFGTNLDRTDEAARYIESILKEREEVLHYAANIGHGNPRIYYNVFPKSERSTHAQIFVQLCDIGADEMAAFISDIRESAAAYPGAEIRVKEFEQGPPVEAPIAIRILSDNLEDLKQVSMQVEEIIASQPGTINIDNRLRSSKNDIHVNINRDKAAMLGVPLVDIDRIVRAGIAGLPVTQYRDENGKEYDIVVRLPMEGRPSLEEFDHVSVASVTGAQIPLKQLATIEFTAGPTEINHYNLDRSTTVTADVMRGYSVDRITKEIISRIEQLQLPRGCRFSIGGELESRAESFTGLMQAIIAALISILAVLVLQFRSFRQPLIVFAAIPLAVVGSMFALLITRNTFSFSAFVGLTSLVGIVVNNSIILVDYTNKLRRSGKELLEALQEAGETRFTPIILTTATTICGLLPLTLSGGELWAPMGWTIIGGLAASTFLTLIVVPVLYRLGERPPGK